MTIDACGDYHGESVRSIMVETVRSMKVESCFDFGMSVVLTNAGRGGEAGPAPMTLALYDSEEDDDDEEEDEEETDEEKECGSRLCAALI